MRGTTGFRVRSRHILAASAAAVAVTVLAPLATASAATVVNGDFESGALAGWTLDTSDPCGGCTQAAWYAYSGALSPVSGFPVPAPPQGTYAAITDQTGPGSEILYQDVPLAAGANHALSLTAYYRNPAGAFATPPSLRETTSPNQQYRIDVVKPSAPVDSLAPADVLLNAFKTNVGDPASRDPFTVTADLSPYAGQTVRLRFAGVQTQFFLQAGVDDVKIDSTALYAGQVAGDSPLAWYRLGEPSGTTMLDSAGSRNGRCQNGVTNGAPGAIAGDPNTARGFDGRAAYCYVNGIAAPAAAYTLEGWMKLSALTPGTIVDHGAPGRSTCKPTGTACARRRPPCAGRTRRTRAPGITSSEPGRRPRRRRGCTSTACSWRAPPIPRPRPEARRCTSATDSPHRGSTAPSTRSPTTRPRSARRASPSTTTRDAAADRSASPPEHSSVPGRGPRRLDPDVRRVQISASARGLRHALRAVALCFVAGMLALPGQALAADPPTILSAGIDASDRLYVTWRVAAGTTYDHLEFATAPDADPEVPGSFVEENLVAFGCWDVPDACSGSSQSTSLTVDYAVARDRRYFVKVAASVAGTERDMAISPVWVIDEAKPLIAGQPPRLGEREPTNVPAVGRLLAGSLPALFSEATSSAAQRAPGAPAPDSSSPFALPALPRTIGALLSRGVRLRVECRLAPCTVTGRLALGGAALASRRTTVRQAGTTTLVLRPAGRARGRLRGRMRARLQLDASVAPAGGPAASVSRSFVVRRRSVAKRMPAR